MILDPDFREVDEPIVTLRMSQTQAEQLSFAISDLLCWTRGFMAAQPDDFDHAPMGTNEVRELNIALKNAMRRAET